MNQNVTQPGFWTQGQKAWSGIEPRDELLNFDQKKKDGPCGNSNTGPKRLNQLDDLDWDLNPGPKGLIGNRTQEHPVKLWLEKKMDIGIRT